MSDRAGSKLQALRRAGRRVDDFYYGSGLCDDVPALAWFLLSATVPLTLGIAAIASIVLGNGAQAEEVAARFAKLLPPSARDQIIELVLRTRRDSPLLLAIAVVAMVWASAGATGVIERVGSRLLRVARPGAVTLKLHHLALAAGMVFLIALMGVAATEATSLREHLGIDIPRWILSIGAVIVIALVCAVLFRFATTRRVAWRATLRGSLFTAVVLELTPLLAGYYARAVAGRTPVQVFLVLSGLLFACYIVAQGLLIGEGIAISAQRELDRRG